MNTKFRNQAGNPQDFQCSTDININEITNSRSFPGVTLGITPA
jgi:hypothetical protein